ncbi:MAG: S-layer homology domain-containing protein, partial [Clostridiales bacterium]|nr:S-layer homology domain-containing protein [Clostridiales bacterium]
SDNNEIIAFAKQATSKERDTYAIAQAAFAAVNLYMTYVEEDLDSPNHGALRALHRAQGVCEDYSKLYVAVLRALGIAARQQSGYLYLPEEHNKPPYVNEEGHLNFNLLRHAWTEFYLPGKGWVIVDPTFNYSFEVNGQITKYINWDYFAAITKERSYIFFREDSLNEDKLLYYGALKNGHFLDSSLNCYMLKGSQAAFFNDVEDHWAEQAIMRLAERDEPLLQGMGNGMFGVDDAMTRAQLVTCLQRLIKSPPGGPIFTDLAPSHWAYRDIGSAQQAGWISGYPDGSFRPDSPVTRAEVAQLLVDVFKLSSTAPDQESGEEKAETENEEMKVEDTPLGEYAESKEAETAEAEQTEKSEEETDVVKITEDKQALPLSEELQAVFLDLGQVGTAWADDAITTLFRLGFCVGDGHGFFWPMRPVTRAEFAALLDRIIIAQEKKAQEPEQEEEQK